MTSCPPQELAETLDVGADNKYVTTGGRGDWETRFGHSGPPITLRPIWAYTVTHKVIILITRLERSKKFAFLKSQFVLKGKFRNIRKLCLNSPTQ